MTLTVTTCPLSRWGHVSSTVGGVFYVCGGTTDLAGYIAPNNTCDSYSVVERQWSVGRPMLSDRHWAAGVESFGEMYVLGGVGPGGNATDSVEVFEPKAGAWRNGRKMPRALAGHCAVAMGDVIVVLGGQEQGRAVADTFMFNVTSMVWTKLADMPTPRRLHGCSGYLRSVFGTLNDRF